MRELGKWKADIKAPDDLRSMYLLLKNFGPKLDPRRNQSVGFLNEAVMIHAFNAHDTLIVYEDSIYLMWMDSTAGMTLGEMVMPCPVYVSGTATAGRMRDGVPRSVTVLQTVSEDELKQALLATRPPATATASPSGNSSNSSSGSLSTATVAPSADGYRVWTDRTGKFTIEAMLLSSTDEEVRLRKRDGSVLTIKTSILCDADIRYLKQ